MSADREIPAEDSIKVVCRFRPLNDSEEKAGSKFVVKFPQGPEENCLSIGVSTHSSVFSFAFFVSQIPPMTCKSDVQRKIFRHSFRLLSFFLSFIHSLVLIALHIVGWKPFFCQSIGTHGETHGTCANFLYCLRRRCHRHCHALAYTSTREHFSFSFKYFFIILLF